MNIVKEPTVLKLIILYVGAAILGLSIGIFAGLYPWDHLWQFWR